VPFLFSILDQFFPSTSIMKNIFPLLVLSCLVFLLLQCEENASNTIDNNAVATSTPLDSLPTAIPDDENVNRDRVKVGQLKEACQLVSEDWIRQNIPGFEPDEIRMISRTSPDGIASACQCTQSTETSEKAFVIGYRVSAGNMQFINTLMTEGMTRSDGTTVPPYQEVRGLGQRAAFSRANGNLAWVTDSGLYIYMHIFPKSADTMREHFDLLYALAPEINAVVAKYGNKE
jgi:hypothetical protein